MYSGVQLGVYMASATALAEDLYIAVSSTMQ